LISEDLEEDMLISKSDLIKLKRIPEGFPNVIVEKCRTITTFKEKLIKKFPRSQR